MPRSVVLALLVGWALPALAAPGYAWRLEAGGEPLVDRVAPPSGAARVAVATGSFGAWLRRLPLLPAGTGVRLFDGRPKARQDVHAAVVDLDVGTRDLQQCADAVMRLRAEYLYAASLPIAFHPDPGAPRTVAWAGGDRRAFERYLVRVFADAGTASLAAELPRVGARPVEPGDVLIQGGYPGHAVLVLDVAIATDGKRYSRVGTTIATDGKRYSRVGTTIATDGKRYLLLGQSYMPAQQFHVLRNLSAPALSPWFDASLLDSTGVATPEWRPFVRADLRRF